MVQPNTMHEASSQSSGPRARDEALSARVARLSPLLRETPIIQLKHDAIELNAKLEFTNPIGSIKDRPAFWILKNAIDRGDVTSATTIVESSSGNFALALAVFCRLLGLRFIPVIDPNISPSYEDSLRRTCNLVVKVEERDDTGGFLKTRLAKVQELCSGLKNAYWTNQYANLDGMQAHYKFTGGEIVKSFTHLDYVFLGVSSGGTISGVSTRLKEAFPKIKVIAVDSEGSVIFGGKPKKRYIPGIGASIVPPLVKLAIIDDVVMVAERETAAACNDLLLEHGLFVGGSSGTAYAAIQRYVPKMLTSGEKPRVVFICPDRGSAYLDTVYHREWRLQLEEKEP